MTSKTAVCDAIRAQKRWSFTLDLTDLVLYQHTGERIPQVAIRLLTRSEQDDAAASAHAYVARLAQRAEMGRDGAKADAELLDEAKSVECIWRAYRVPGNEVEAAFISPEWIRETFDTDTIAALVNLYNESRKLRYPDAWTIDADRLAALAEGCGKAAGTDWPEQLLARVDREHATQLFVLLAQKWWAEQPQPAEPEATTEEPAA